MNYKVILKTIISLSTIAGCLNGMEKKPIIPVPGPELFIHIKNQTNQNYTVKGKVGALTALSAMSNFNIDITAEWYKLRSRDLLKSNTFTLADGNNKPIIEIQLNYAPKQFSLSVFDFALKNMQTIRSEELDAKKGIPNFTILLDLKGKNLQDSNIDVSVSYQSLRSKFDIRSNSIEGKILELGFKKNFDEIQKIVENSRDFNELKKLILLQLNMALFIVNRTSFKNIGDDDSTAFNYPEQNIIQNPADPIRIQWLYVLLQARNNDAEKANSIEMLDDTFICIHDLLADLGGIGPYPNLENEESIKNALINNFTALLGLLFITRHAQPSFDIKKLEEQILLKKIQKIWY